jgi:hypothetical protein
MIISALLWAACVSCLLLAASGFVRMARTDGGHRDAGSWHAPLIFTSAALALLTAAGVIEAILGAFLALLPLAVIASVVARPWRSVARADSKGKATRVVAGGLGARVLDSLWNAREDLRDAGARLRPVRVPAPSAAAVPRPVRLPLPARRPVPSPHSGPAAGPAPAVAEVGAALEGVLVPPELAAAASLVADFDPGDDEDELLGFVASLAAGILVFSEAFDVLAENLLTGPALDPAYALGFIDIGYSAADLATAVTELDRRYHEVYEGVHEHVDSGLTLPHNARQWFHAGEGAPEGGAAA